MKGSRYPNSSFLKIIQILTVLLLLINYESAGQEKKVLFLGNSYTAVNNLPLLVSELAISGGHSIYTDRNTPGGYTLAFPSNGHLYNQNSLDKIAEEDWDYVVLQEQSQFPVIDFYRNNYTFPGAVKLDSIIRQNNPCSKTLFYMTWGRKYGGEQCIDGHCSVAFTDYAHMQDSLASAYLSMSNFLETPVCPAGLAWKKSIVQNGDPVELFSGDGSHPSLAGSYLIACAYYATIFHESPIGLSYTGGLDESVAEYLQSVASETVLDNLALWNIDTTSVVSEFNYNQMGGVISFENLSVNAENFLWDFGNGVTDTTANPIYTYYESGSFEVSLISYSGCEADTAHKIIQVILSGLDNDNRSIPMSIYPIPARDYLVVEYELDNASSSFVLNIIDTMGIIHQTNKVNGNLTKVIIDMDSLSDGIYFVNIISGEGQIIGSKSFIKE